MLLLPQDSWNLISWVRFQGSGGQPARRPREEGKQDQKHKMRSANHLPVITAWRYDRCVICAPGNSPGNQKWWQRNDSILRASLAVPSPLAQGGGPQLCSALPCCDPLRQNTSSFLSSSNSDSLLQHKWLIYASLGRDSFLFCDQRILALLPYLFSSLIWKFPANKDHILFIKAPAGLTHGRQAISVNFSQLRIALFFTHCKNKISSW